MQGTGAVKNMLETLSHRGPDDVGVYHDPKQDVAFGHRRLSIIDLSPAGHQPMADQNQLVWVSFNGEIYNYKELRDDLRKKGYQFQSASDTEVLIHGYLEYGIDIFSKIDGMWAIALYDKRRKLLILGRDIAGIKPLYIYRSGGAIMFASEINAITKALPKGSLTTRPGSVYKFLTHGYLYGNETIYNEIERIPQGTIFIYNLATNNVAEHRTHAFKQQGEIKSLDEACARFNDLFATSVASTLQADVPVGLFLSGGIDSTLIGRYVQKAGATIEAFTIGFHERSFNESSTASRIASMLQLPHTTHILQPNDIADDITRIIDSYGEPFADTSAIPTYYVSKLARERGIKVALAGDGADELFGGYQTHYLPLLARFYQITPSYTDTLLTKLSNIPPATFTKLGNREKVERFLHSARLPYREAHAHWKYVFKDTELKQLLAGGAYEQLSEKDSSFNSFFSELFPIESNAADEVMKIDFFTFLSGSCLVKSDIASMQHGLEIRVPFLTNNIIDFAWNLPVTFKISPFRTKKLLREVLSRHLLSSITRLPKQGFVPPLAEWLSDGLKPTMLDILSEPEIAKVGFLRYNYIVNLISEHIERKTDHSKKLWALMSLVRFYSRTT